MADVDYVEVNMANRVKVREQEAKVRAKNFDEVCFGYNEEEAALEASRCLHCKNPKCVEGCPVGLHIPDFIEHIKNKEYDKALAKLNETLEAKKEQLGVLQERNAIWHQIDALIG